MLIHAGAWYVWLVCVLAAVSATRNPLYLLLLLAEIALVVEALYASGAEVGTRAPITPGRFAFFVVPMGALFNALLTHVGATVLWRLPEAIPLLGGPVTLEGVVYGALNGMVLAAFFAAFTVLNLAVPIRDLIRLVPRAFYPLAVVVSVAVTFVPTTQQQIQQIREAQAVRGHRMRGARDWFPLFMPLLVGGLERALQLAEAMTARGFAADAGTARAPWVRVGLISSLLLLLSGGLLHWVWALSAWGGFLLLLGALVLGYVLWQAGRQIAHTRYRQTSWDRGDILTVVAAILAIIPLWLQGDAARLYTPYPVLTLPPFDVLVGLSLLGLIVPVGGGVESRKSKVESRKS